MSLFFNYPVPIYFYLAALVVSLPLFNPNVLSRVVQSKFLWLGGAAAFIAGMILLPSENHLMGDGMQRLSDPEKTIMPTEFLDILVHRLVYAVVGSSLWSYRIVSLIAGLFYLNGIRLMARLGSCANEKAIIVLAFLCTATIQFYFGYVEGYGLLNLFTLYYLYFAWKGLEEDSVGVAPAICFVLAALSHMSGAALFPSLVFLYREKYPRTARYLVPIIVMAALGVFLAGRFWRALVVLLPNEYSSYSFFSAAHWLDMFKILLLVSPAFFLALFGKRWDKETKFTVAALVGTLAFTLTFDPVLGAIRDWDILSLFALPLAGLIALRAPRNAFSIVVLVVAIICRIVPWIVFNSQPQIASMKEMLSNDVHYSENFGKGERLDSWGILLYHLGDLQGAEDAWTKRLSYAPTKLNTMSMLAPLQYRMGKYSDAAQTYLKMLAVEPDNAKTRYHAIYVLFRSGSFNNAMQVFVNSPPEFQVNPGSQRLFAGLLSAMGSHEEAVALVEQNPIPDNDPYLPYVLAKSCLESGRMDLARQLIQNVISLDSTTVEYQTLARLILKN